MTKFKQIALIVSLTGVGFASTSVLAADAAPPPYTLTANVGLYSQYVFRGLTQTNEDPAVQGGFDFTHSSGFYLGTWASNISWLKENATTAANATAGSYNTGGSIEMDFYGGYRGSVGDFGYDVGLLQYYYPGTVIGTNIKADTLEAYIAGSWKWLSLKYSQSLGDTFGVKDASGTYYLDLSANVPIAETGLTLGLHYGTQQYKGKDYRNVGGANNDTLDSYDDYKVSLAYDLGKTGKLFENTTVGIAYTDTTGANKCAYGSYSDTCKINGTTYSGVFPKNIAKSQTTVWIQRTF
ncbi:MAG: TorF family putative porin [Burkholderiales bacterium]